MSQKMKAAKQWLFSYMHFQSHTDEHVHPDELCDYVVRKKTKLY